MAKKAKTAKKAKSANGNQRTTRRPWSKDDVRDLKAHSKAKTPVARISRAMKRTVRALQQQASKLGIGLGHRR
jgi:hypothetical protein